MLIELDSGLYIPEAEVREIRRSFRPSARFQWTVKTRSGEKHPCNELTTTHFVENTTRIYGVSLSRYDDGREEITRLTVVAWRITAPALDRVPNRAQWVEPVFAGDSRDAGVAVCLHDPETGQYWDPGMWWADDWGKALEKLRRSAQK